MVFLIALPLCLGIALASGYPAVAGILTAVVGGMVSSFLGSSPLTIKGPAAGLIVIVVGAVTELGHGDLQLGYHRALAVGVIAAALQILLGLFRVASVGIAISPAVVHGMLASIGVIIISKQVHALLGVVPQAKTPLMLLAEIPQSLVKANPKIFIIGLVSLLILFLAPKIKTGLIKALPAQLLVLMMAVPLVFILGVGDAHTYTLFGHAYEMGPHFLLRLPDNIIGSLGFPDFAEIGSLASIKYIAMFCLVGTIESTLSVLAVDALDPKKRASDLNRDLFAVGVGNFISSWLGGLPMITEIVRSKANIDAKAQSSYSNFFHGIFLLLFVLLAPQVLHIIPLAALAAMLIYTGTRLASVAELLRMKRVGLDQLFLFCATMIMCLATDLLVGVITGVALKILLHLVRGASLKSIFWPRIDCRVTGEEMRIQLQSIASFTSLLAIQRSLKNMPDKIKSVVIDCSDALLVDHTFLARIKTIAAAWPNSRFEVVGMGHLRPASSHPQSARAGRMR